MITNPVYETFLKLWLHSPFNRIRTFIRLFSIAAKYSTITWRINVKKKKNLRENKSYQSLVCVIDDKRGEGDLWYYPFNFSHPLSHARFIGFSSAHQPLLSFSPFSIYCLTWIFVIVAFAYTHMFADGKTICVLRQKLLNICSSAFPANICMPVDVRKLPSTTQEKNHYISLLLFSPHI